LFLAGEREPWLDRLRIGISSIVTTARAVVGAPVRVLQETEKTPLRNAVDGPLNWALANGNASRLRPTFARSHDEAN
jgi:hypothetical protein